MMKKFRISQIIILIIINFDQIFSIDDDIIDLSHLGSRIYGQPNEEIGKILANFNENLGVNPEELGTYAEGDILTPRSFGRNGIVGESFRWTNGIVPFEIRGNFNAQEMDLIGQAIESYHKNTCIKFIPRSSNDNDYISIQDKQSGCWSSVGRVKGQQIVNLQSPGCVMKVGTIIHELMHAVGFLHEQNRDERDNYVTIHFGNIMDGAESNFGKAPLTTAHAFGIEYDLGSVMHYSSHAFSKNKEPTIVPKRATKDVMGQREGFSQLDIQKIWKMYKCKASTSSSGYKPNMAHTIESGTGLIEDLINIFVPHEDSEESMRKLN